MQEDVRIPLGQSGCLHFGASAKTREECESLEELGERVSETNAEPLLKLYVFRAQPSEDR